MSDDNAKPGIGAEEGQIIENAQTPAENTDKQTMVSLDRMNEGMFQKPIVRKLLRYTQLVGNYGHTKSIPDSLDANQLVESIKECLVSYKKFSHFAELLLNGIYHGTISEEEVTLTADKLIESIQYWIYFRVDMGFGKGSDVDAHIRETERVLETLLKNNILGDSPEEVMLKLMNSSFPGETRKFIEGFAEKYLKADTKQHIQEEEERARKEFEASFRDSSTGKYSQTIRPGGPTPPKGTPVQKDPQQAQEPEQQVQAGQQEQEASGTETKEEQEADISKVTVSVARWHQDEEYEKRSYIKVTRKGIEYDPVITPGRPIEMVDEEDVANVTASVEIQGNKLVIVPKGSDPIIDLDSGVVVHRLVIDQGKPSRVQLDEDMFEINIERIERVGAVAAAVRDPDAEQPQPEPSTVHEDSQPTIEARETESYNLPAVMCVDETGDVLSTYICLDEGDRVVRIGTDPSNDIILRPDQSDKPFAAEVKFLNGRVYINSGKDCFIRTKKSVPNSFISTRAVHFDEDDVMIIGGKDVPRIYFKASAEHPFLAEDVKSSLGQRLEKISNRLAIGSGVQAVTEVEAQLADYDKTVDLYKDKLDVQDLVRASGELSEKATQTKVRLAEKERLEYEAKMATRRHFDETAGETLETPRPFKYAVLIDKVYKNRDGGKILRPIFPPGLSMGKDKVNTLEAHLPRVERGSKYGVQDFECTFVTDGTNIRMVLEPRMLKNSKILVNGQIPGTREGKTSELDMLRAPLIDGDDIEVGLDRFGFETGHEFTLGAIRPFAAEYLREIMEVFVLYPDHGDDGDKKNARATLEHFLTAGIITQAEVDRQQAVFEEEKLGRETTGMAVKILRDMNEQHPALSQYIESDEVMVGLPYDAALFRAAMELLDEPAVRWDETGWMKEEYVKELKRAATLRLLAYDKKLLDIRTKLQQNNYGSRLKSFFSREAEQEFSEEQESLHRGFRKILVEMVSLMQMGAMSDSYGSNWLTTRLSREQGEQADEIFFAQRVVGQIHEGAEFSGEEVKQLLEKVKDKTYGEYLNFGEAPFEAPMRDFVLAKVKARAKALFAEAAEGENISANLGRLEGLIAAGLVTYEAVHSTPEQFRELRDMEEYFTKQKAGHTALAVLMSASEPSLEDIVDFAQRMQKDEFSLSDEKDGEFRAYCRKALQEAAQKARVGHMSAYFAVLASTVVRLKLAKPRDAGMSMDELQGLHEVEENTSGVKVMLALAEEIRGSGIHNIHPLLKLKSHIEANGPGTLNHEGKSGEQILQELVETRMEAMLGHVKEGRDPGFMAMVVEDMSQFGLGAMMGKYIERQLREGIEQLYEGRKTVDEIRPFVESLRLLGLDELLTEVGSGVITEHLTKSFDDPSSDVVSRVEKLGEELRALGLN